jgi:hypothetical protein
MRKIKGWHAGLRHADDTEARGSEEEKIVSTVLSAFVRGFPASVLPRAVFLMEIGRLRWRGIIEAFPSGQ